MKQKSYLNLARQVCSVRTLGVFGCAVLLASCGGGGGGPSPSPALAEQVTANVCNGAQIVTDIAVDAGRATSATAQACFGSLSEVSWTQVSGPTVKLSAARALTVAFEPTTSGTIRLRLDATLPDGSAASSTADITVRAAPTGSFINVRADHSVRDATNTSLRAWPALVGADTVTSIVWTQIAGPSVTMDTSDNRVLLFKAPVTVADTLLKFRATMTTSSGRVDSDDATILVEHVPAPTGNSIFDVTERVHAYRPTAPYAKQLVRCTYDVALYFASTSDNNFCNSATLPLIGTEVGADNVPTVSDIMGRVLVSHDFLGANFEQFLLTKDTHGDFRRLLSGATAIVIGSHVRPSFYTSATGAIYLDANYLWLTADERDVVTEVPDFRASFADELNFTGLGRAVLNNNYATFSYSPTARVARGVDDLLFRLGRLMYHELAHANDFFSPLDRQLLPSKSIYDNVSDRISSLTLPSDQLARNFGLRSTEMKGLGQVMYQGAAANAAQKAYTPADVGRFFSSDRASDDYAYSISGNANSREDVAVLFEEFMMSYRHGVQFDVAYSNKYTPDLTSNDLFVAWGQRGRIADPAIKPRIKLVLQKIAPWIDPAVVDKLPAPVLMRVGASWTANLDLSRSGVAQRKANALKAPNGAEMPRAEDDVRRGPVHGRVRGPR